MKPEELFDARVVSIIRKVLKVSIWWMIKCDLLKLSFVLNFHNKFRLIFFQTERWDCVIKTRDVFSFLPLINNSVTVRLSFLLLSISAIISNTVGLDCILQC